jgi:NAD(P)-dependent dehydrogenase (short-subunit alcohol dehydrogenase family)/acyl carrier protein
MTDSHIPSQAILHEEISKLLSSYFSKRGSFLAQVILADLQSLSDNQLFKSYAKNKEQQKQLLLDNTALRQNESVLSVSTVAKNANFSYTPSINTDKAYQQVSLDNLESLLIELVTLQTGFPRTSISLDARLLDDLNLDSIKGGELIAEFAKRCGVAGIVDPTTLANATLKEILTAVQAVRENADVSITVPTEIVSTVVEQEIPPLMLGLVAQYTGFPSESLSLNLRLLDDLNLDSIKSAELVAEAAKRLGIAGQIDPAQFANATLGEIAQILAQHRQPSLTSSVAVTAPSVKATSPWVRNFVVEYVPQEPISLDGEVEENWETANLFAEDDWKLAHVLVVAESTEKDWVQALTKTLETQGAKVESVTYEALIETQKIHNPQYTHFIAILPRKVQGEMEAEARLLRAMTRVRAIATPLAAAQIQRNYIGVAYLQFGGGYFGRLPQTSDIEQCGTMGFAASLHLERADLKVRVIDLPNQKATKNLSEKVLRELGRREAYLSVGYDADLIRRIVRPQMQERTQYTPRNLSWSSEDVLLIPGGAKGITAECAIAFARLTGVKTALVGSSPHPQEDPLSSSAQEIAKTLRTFSLDHLTCAYYQCDITNPEAVSALVAQVQKELGQITGVIHGAALNKPRRVENSTLAEARGEVGPKVLGLLNLMQAFAHQPPRLFIGFSSISAVLGLPGNTWYGFSNEVMDLLLRNFAQNHPQTSVLAMAFSVWSEVGMGARMGTVRNLNRMGIEAMPTEDGVSRFLELMFKDPGYSQVVITSKLGGIETMRRGFDTWRTERYAPPTTFKFIENIHTIELGVEVASRTRLTLERDSYVKDHIYKGSYLFPTVFGLEAMAQSALYAARQTSPFSQIRLEDIRLERPIVVDPENGVEIEIWSEVLERKSPQDPLKVRTEIRTERTGFNLAHFAATFILTPQNSEIPQEALRLPLEPLAINPQLDLYSWLLFQGPRFQRLEEAYLLNSQQFIFSSRITTSQEDAPSQDRATGPFILGDPYCRDSLLQSVQPIIPQDICLPISIDSLHLYQIQGEKAGSCFGIAINEGCQGKEYRTNVTALNEQGQVLEKLAGYQLRILEHRADHPTAEDLANFSTRSEQLLNEQLQRHSATLGIDAPQISLAYMPGLQELPLEERREKEIPLFTKAVSHVLAHPTS